MILRLILCYWISKYVLLTHGLKYIRIHNYGFLAASIGEDWDYNWNFPRSIALSSDFADLILIDQRCGIRDGRCSRFCNDPNFSEFYCPAHCFSFTRQQRFFICNYDGGERFLFDGRSSPTAHQLPNETEWVWQTAGLRLMRGERWTETFTVNRRLGIRPPPMDIRLVSARLFDQRALHHYSGVFGLAPGPDSPVVQIAQHHSLLKSFFTKATNVWTIRHQPPLGGGAYTIGYPDMARCVDWGFVDSLANDRWVLPIDSVDFMGVNLTRPAMAVVAFDKPGIHMSAQMAAELESRGIIHLYSETLDEKTYSVECQSDPLELGKVVWRSGQLEFRLSARSLHYGFVSNNGRIECRIHINVNKRNPFVNSNVWVFGSQFFEENCVGLDYENNRIGIGRLRMYPFPYETPVYDGIPNI